MENQPVLSFLVTHFNRPDALKSLINSIRDFDLPFSYEIVVSDDASKSEIIEEIKRFDIDNLVLTSVNCGLAHNINKGIKSCRGKYLLYFQEDILPEKTLSAILPELLEILESGRLDMIRLMANYRFPKLIPITNKVSLIPQFSFKNFLYNQFRYSDNPYLVRKDFFDTYGYYLENSSSSYGENEYMVRMMKSNAKIGIINEYQAQHSQGIASVKDDNINSKRKSTGVPKLLKRYLRSLKFIYEAINYDMDKRRLKTYKNLRR